MWRVHHASAAGRAAAGPAAGPSPHLYRSQHQRQRPGSLRQAIIDANNNPHPDTIAFDIPPTDPGYSWSNAWVIQPSSLPPSLTGGGTTIDGTTQTTNRGDTNSWGPEVHIYGYSLSPTAWIFSVESNNNTIKGLAITDAGGAGIKIIAGASGNTISNNYITEQVCMRGCPR